MFCGAEFREVQTDQLSGKKYLEATLRKTGSVWRKVSMATFYPVMQFIC